MIPINKRHEPFLMTMVHDKEQSRGAWVGVHLRDQAGDMDQ